MSRGDLTARCNGSGEGKRICDAKEAKDVFAGYNGAYDDVSRSIVRQKITGSGWRVPR